MDAGSTAIDAGYFGAPRCAGAAFAVCESFETAAIGGLPTGWMKRPGSYGGKSMGVAADEKARGKQSLKIEGGATGAQWLQYAGNLAGLANAHYGRLFFKVAMPAPVPVTGVLHADVFESRGPSPVNGSITNQVRWGTVGNTQGKHQWIYNVQRSQGGEFAFGTDYTYAWTGEWTCVEWRLDATNQQARLWLDGAQVDKVTVDRQMGSQAAELPIFADLSVGWANYQTANPGFVVWIDEVVFDANRVGCTQ